MRKPTLLFVGLAALLAVILALAYVANSPKATAPDTKPRLKPIEVQRLDTTEDLHGIIATRTDGSRFIVFSDPGHQFSFTSDSCALQCSRDLNWAIVEWTNPDSLGGSLGGRIETLTSLLSVQHRRLLDAADLGFAGASLASIEQEGSREVLVLLVSSKRGPEEKKVDINDLDALVKHVAQGAQPPGK